MKNRRDRREPYAGDKHRTINIRVPFEFKTEIEALADKLDISVSALARNAIDRLLENGVEGDIADISRWNRESYSMGPHRSMRYKA